MKKDPNKYPAGWNAAKVRKVIDYYDRQSEDQGAEEILNAKPGKAVTWIEVPNELLPDIRKLIARRRKSA